MTLQQLNLRRDFPLLQQQSNGKPLIYLDSASTTQKPASVIQAMSNYYLTMNANIHRGVYRLSQDATAAYEEAHRNVAGFINAGFEEVIFTKSATESLNLLAYTLTKGMLQGEEIVLTQMEHHSNLVPWQQLAKERGLVVKYIRLTPDFRLDMQHAKEMITKRTKVVSVCHMSNVLGTINPITELASLAHAQGAVLVVDGAQGMPHLPVDVKALGCDFYAASGHKMLGPTGIGILYGKKALLEKLPPFLYGGDMIREVSYADSTFNDLPWKFEAGTPNIAEAIGLAAAIDYLRSIGMEQVQQHEMMLTEYALAKLGEMPGVRIIGPATAEQRSGVISFAVDGIHTHDVATVLDSEGIAVRGGHHCAMPLMELLGLAGTTRASFSVYNTQEEVDALVAAIQKAQRIFGYGQ
ncbi:cysteine desulfurase [Candidatus Woesearchaeota archaeon]|nr:cysteine desulfurase [Candidatus Woesearchaeota archaeon]